MHPMLNIAVRAARRAGDIIARALEQGRNQKSDNKGLNDYVTEIDLQAEAAIIDILLRAYPKHGIIAEESGTHPAEDGESYWIIDPLDGTTNFIHGYLQFCVSIALQQRGQIQQAVVYDPISQELYTASRGSGAFLNNRRLRVSQSSRMHDALLGTGFPFRNEDYVEVYLSSLRRLFAHTAGIRRAGSAALDLAHVAAGRLDGFWEFGLRPWDIAAGSLLILEAGGRITNIQDNTDFMQTGHVVAGNPKIYAQLRDIIRESLPEDFRS